MSSGDSDKKFMPSKFAPRTAVFVEHIEQTLSVLDFHMNFDNEFQEFKLLMKFVNDMQEAIEQENIPLKKYDMEEKLMPNQKAISRMDKIWNGGCYFAVKFNENKTRILNKVFCYEKPVNGVIDGVKFDEFIPTPKLRNMVPAKPINQDTWGIEIRESYPLIFAWEGANYATVVSDGKFSHRVSEGLIPKIQPKDMYSRSKRTYILHRPVYFRLMDDLTHFLQKNRAIFTNNMQKIIKWMEEEMELGDIEIVSTEDTSDKEGYRTDSG